MHHLENCPHAESRWCGECVKSVGEQLILDAACDFSKRLVEFGMGRAVDGVAGCVCEGTEGGIDRVSRDRSRIESKANKSLLKILGNGWVPTVPALIFQWIVEQEQYT